MSKIATDFEQSKKLAEILPIDSADMSWTQIYDENHMMSDYRLDLLPHKFNRAISKPAWSLSALMDALPNEVRHELKVYHFKMTTDVYSDGEKYYDLGYQGVGYWLEYEDSKDLVDACVEMIVKLKEKNLL